jgi:aminoglycoside phosphotransferase (APT) family kinase protein
MIEELRNVQAIENQGVTGVDGGLIYDPRLPKSSFWGPFKTIYEFYYDLRNGIDENNVYDNTLPGLRELVSFYNQAWGRPVLTHGDLSSLNILVQGEQVVGIIDWETAGWLPPY